MTTARPARTATAAALLLLGTLAACSTRTGAVSSAPPDLAGALAVDLEGFAQAAVADPPATVCRDGNYNEKQVPEVPDYLGEPTAAGYSSEGADLHAWAWHTPTAGVATTAVDDAVADLEGCSYEIYFDSDTDGDGRIDAGGSEQQSARPWSDENWTGMSASGHFSGSGGGVVESRFARRGDVVVLVVLDAHGSDDPPAATVDAYLDGVAAALG